MIGLDTNVLVRYIMQDDAKQSWLATELLDTLSPESPGFFAQVSVVELVWVCRLATRLTARSSSTRWKAFFAPKKLALKMPMWSGARRGAIVTHRLTSPIA